MIEQDFEVLWVFSGANKNNVLNNFGLIVLWTLDIIYHIYNNLLLYFWMKFESKMQWITIKIIKDNQEVTQCIHIHTVVQHCVTIATM